jgi:hypothetical protein
VDERGALLFEYRPPAAHPILYALAIVSGFVLLTGSAEAAVRGAPLRIVAIYAAPLVATLLLMALLRPSPVRIHEQGIAPSRPMALRWRRPFIRWDEAAAVYPQSYDVTGAFVSPFASSDGKVTQTGLGIELRGGRVETVPFTPTRFSETSRRSRGYREAMEVVRERFAQMGRPLVPEAEQIPPEERARLLEEARRPFLPFFAIVFLFASAAPALGTMLWLGLDLRLALPIALALPLGTSLQSWLRSRRRNRILGRLSKAAEHARAQAAP